MYIKYMIDVHVGLRPNVDMVVLGTVTQGMFLNFKKTSLTSDKVVGSYLYSQHRRADLRFLRV